VVVVMVVVLLLVLVLAENMTTKCFPLVVKVL
jgi:hypothetical protein